MNTRRFSCCVLLGVLTLALGGALGAATSTRERAVRRASSCPIA